MNANVSESASLYGKMIAMFVAALFVISSFSLLVSASSDEEQESNITEGIILGEALVQNIVSNEGVKAVSEFNPVPADVDTTIPLASTMATGWFSPAREPFGASKVFLMDDDAENWMSGPWLEASHIETALNDGGYSFDVFRGGKWEGINKEIPHGATGVDLINDYEVVIWYSGWNTLILSGDETSVLEDYLDGTTVSGANNNYGVDCDEYGQTSETYCVENRNIIVSTQMSDWLDAYSGSFENNYLHSDTQSSAYLIVDGTSNPMKGVEDSIFEGEEYATDSAGVHYLDRPCGIKPVNNVDSVGAFWYDAHATSSSSNGHNYHAVQFPAETYVGAQTHKAFHFADEIGVFNKREDRKDFFSTILGWMDVTKESAKNIDMGISGLDIPNHVQYWRSVESMVGVDIKVTVTNYGMLPQGSTALHLRLKNEFGQILFDSTFDTRAFPAGHEMHVPDSIQSGDSVVFTFNLENDALQREYDGLDPGKAREVMFTSAGMDKVIVQIVHTGDQSKPNNYVQADVGVGKWIENGEAPIDEIGPSSTIQDTQTNNPSFNGVNMHRTSSYDWDADGCGYAVAAETCVPQGRTLNKTVRSVYHEGKSAFGMFNRTGWYKDGAVPANCEWGANSLSDGDCPKFTMQPNQDDHFFSPALDLSAMQHVVIGMLFTGCMESGDQFVMSISKDNGVTWNNLISYSGFCPGEGAWYLWGGSDSKYQGYQLSSAYYGEEDTQNIRFRVMADADPDQNTEGGRPYPGWFIDEIVFRGTEEITRDVAISDVTVRDSNFKVKDNQGNDLYREINATVENAGSSPWETLGVKISVTDLQKNNKDILLDTEGKEIEISSLAGNSFYGNIEENADQKEIFALFRTEEANTYFAEVTALVPEGLDYFPWNNSMKVMFRVFDTFFYDNVDDNRENYNYIKVEREANSDVNSWVERDVDDDAYSKQYVWMYAKENGWSKESSTTVKDRDDGLITQDNYDRGTNFAMDVNVDLRAAFKPYVGYAIKWDLAPGDILEVRASKDFDSSQKISSGTWTVLKTYTGLSDGSTADSCACPFRSSEAATWHVEELSLAEFEGYQTWIEFRAVTKTGGGEGVMIDDIMVIGNEYRNNVDIVNVDTDKYASSGNQHDLSVTVRGVGTNPQTGVSIYAFIKDSNGVKVWPEETDVDANFYDIPETWDPDEDGVFGLEKGQEFTLDPNNLGAAGDDWRWGSNLAPGIYYLEVSTWTATEADNEDENPENNVVRVTIVLGAALLTGDQWGHGSNIGSDGYGDNMGDGWSPGSYVWNGEDDGSLVSDTFVVWNRQPFLIVESEYELIDAHVKAQVCTSPLVGGTPCTSTSGGWHEIKWRTVDESKTLYSIPTRNYTDLPDRWTGSSNYANSTTQTFFADLGATTLGDGSGTLQSVYVGSQMTIRLTGTNTGESGSDGGQFTAYYPTVFGLDDYSVDVKEISPLTQNAEPSSSTGDEVTKTYVVKVSNFGATSDSAVVDFSISTPKGPGTDSTITLDETVVTANGNSIQASIDSIIQKEGVTYVAISPTMSYWGGLAPDTADCAANPMLICRDDADGGDNTAYIRQDGLKAIIEWPSGMSEAHSKTGWSISNPTKQNWDPGNNKPMKPSPASFVNPGSVMTVPVEVTVGLAAWAPPGAYQVQADAHSWFDYEDTFTIGDSDGQASMIIAKPDLYFGSDIRYISQATGFGEPGVGWVKHTGCTSGKADTCENDPYFSFMFEVLNSGTETVGTFRVGLIDFDGNPLGVQVGLYWTTGGWAIDTEATTQGIEAEVIEVGTGKSKDRFITFKAIASQLGMTKGPGDTVSGQYNFFLEIDTGKTVSESDENNNKVPIVITAVKEVNTVPSFSLSMLSVTLSGLLAAIGISLRQRYEEEE